MEEKIDLQTENNTLKMKLRDLEASPTIKDKQIMNLLKEIRHLEKEPKGAGQANFESQYRALQTRSFRLEEDLNSATSEIMELTQELNRPRGIKAFFKRIFLKGLLMNLDWPTYRSETGKEFFIGLEKGKQTVPYDFAMWQQEKLRERVGMILRARNWEEQNPNPNGPNPYLKSPMARHESADIPV